MNLFLLSLAYLCPLRIREVDGTHHSYIALFCFVFLCFKSLIRLEQYNLTQESDRKAQNVIITLQISEIESFVNKWI